MIEEVRPAIIAGSPEPRCLWACWNQFQQACWLRLVLCSGNTTMKPFASASASQAATASYFNWYDKASAGMNNDNIHLFNPGTASVNVTVSLGGASKVVSLAASAQTYVNFPGTLGGPVSVTSTAPVLASQRVQYYQTFNEIWAG